MDNFSYMMERATNMVAYCMLAAFIDKTLEAERKKVKETLGHEPNQENWQDYYHLKQEKTSQRETSQREIDREKLRRLVMGDESTLNI